MGVKNIETIELLNKKLTIAFEMVDIGSISFYFGLKVKRDN